jgi:hypothetical protein
MIFNVTEWLKIYKKERIANLPRGVSLPAAELSLFPTPTALLGVFFCPGF